MGKRKLVLGILAGAVVGGLTTLYDRETRAYTRYKLSTMRSRSKYLIKNPSKAVHNMRTTFDTLNQNFTSGVESVINVLEQVEETFEKVTNKNEGSRID
ncbi:YtxH domain-containing protein [Virgibacillus sp. C22-A2]|uniref:YtxH domain-containing protein n=1 Tax=Virgibacillus tibetensis TaxID=3042313 RepID=A0ABU6KGF6_9BACI|nr:YtxH domain-containing protein [Virgibacillus sp. C22-A2]